jgi:glutathione S-transferase
MKIWGRATSINVQKVLWLAGELGLEFEHIPAGGRFGRLGEPEFAALNPHRRVPVLEDGDLSVWESNSILRYLAGRYGAPDLWDEDPAVRSLADRWMDWELATLQGVFVNGVFWAFFRTPEPQRNWPAIRRGVANSGRLFGLVDGILADRVWLAGERFSLADICVGTMLYRYYELEIERPSLPNVEAWYARLQERPAYREHVMTDFEELRGRSNF